MEAEEIRRQLNLVCENPNNVLADFSLSYIGKVLENDPYFLVDQEYTDFDSIDRNTCLSTFELRKREMRACLVAELKASEQSGNSFIPYKVLNYKTKRSLKNNGHALRGTIYPYINYYHNLFYLNEKFGIVAFNESYENEKLIESFVKENLDTPGCFSIENIPEELDEEKNLILRDVQNQRLSIITGGPGTGKTTWLKAFIKSIPRTKNIMVTATTGKASRRTAEVLDDILEEYPNVNVMTLHKFIGYGHKLSQSEILKIQAIDILIIDEASMLDDEITSLLFKIIHNTKMSVIFEGDIHQLPAVGTGNVLRDLMLLGVKTYRLTKNFRTSIKTIKENAEKILAGDTRLKFDNSFELRPLNEVYMDDSDIIFSPYISKNKEYSSTNINEVYRANKWHDDRPFHVTDEVIFTETSYPNKYMNGDTGVIIRIEPDAYYVLLDFNQETVKVIDSTHILLLHTITIHKSQGSEYDTPAIVIPEFSQEFTTRNLLYTAITRAKQKVIIYSSWDIIKRIIENNAPPKQTFISLGL